MLPSVTFHLGGQDYSLTREDYILWVSSMINAELFVYKNAVEESTHLKHCLMYFYFTFQFNTILYPLIHGGKYYNYFIAAGCICGQLNIIHVGSLSTNCNDKKNYSYFIAVGGQCLQLTPLALMR